MSIFITYDILCHKHAQRLLFKALSVSKQTYILKLHYLSNTIVFSRERQVTGGNAGVYQNKIYNSPPATQIIMTNRDILLVKRSWMIIGELSPKLVDDVFYSKLFEIG